MKRFIPQLLASAIWTVAASAALAAVTAEEAKQLGGKLTAFGAEKAGTADGAIPEYTGGLSTPPAGHKAGGPGWEDPYKADKPLFSVDDKNMAQYADQLTVGTKALLERFKGSLKLDVYPTRRSMYYPQWVLDNTLKNATSAKLSGKVEGDGVEGAYGGVPFPIPKNGYEAMWNFFMRYVPATTDGRADQYLVDSSGALTALTNAGTIFSTPYNDPAKQHLPDNFFTKFLTTLNTPPTQAGTKIAQYSSVNYSVQEQQSWLYTPGQRRVRVAPEFNYDTPIAQNGGAIFYDEIAGFSGRMDRFDFALKGKKQMIVPYNDYGVVFSKIEDVVGPKHIKTEAVRWERHRVWVVEATLKANARHAFARRTFYIDEDSWALVAGESYDSSGKLFRVNWMLPIFFYEKNLGGVYGQTFLVHDMLKGSYYLNNFNTGGSGNYLKAFEKVLDPQQFTPAGMSGSGLR